MGRDGVVGVVTGHRLDDPGFDLRWEQEIFFYTRPERPFSRRNLLHSGYRVITGGKAVEAWRKTSAPT
jgi:hypothetical protein